MKINLGPSTKTAIQEISQILFETEIQTHIIHLQAANKSYAEHKALGDFYESLGDLNDDLVEKSFAKIGMVQYKNIEIKNNLQPLPYIKSNMVKIEELRNSVKEGYIQQMVDNILETFAHTIYKLENLQ